MLVCPNDNGTKIHKYFCSTNSIAKFCPKLTLLRTQGVLRFLYPIVVGVMVGFGGVGGIPSVVDTLCY